MKRAGTTLVLWLFVAVLAITPAFSTQWNASVGAEQGHGPSGAGVFA